MSKTDSYNQDASSFRDPAGFIFKQDGTVYRQINQAGQNDYDHFLNSGLYDKLRAEQLLVPHQELVDYKKFPASAVRYKIIQPEKVPFISYPYEWTFSQLQMAALLTLRIQKIALTYGMILKDASAYNIQFIGYRPIFIDTLSFRIYESGAPWDGYKQFCEHFVAPLALACYSPGILKTLRVFLDGIPLGTARQLLPAKARLRRGLASHIYLHAAGQRRFDKVDLKAPVKKTTLSKLAMEGLLSSLEKTISGLKQPKYKTQWGDYYSDTNYSDTAFAAKKQIVGQLIKQISPKPDNAWDLGANDGTFSDIIAKSDIYTVAFDVDQQAVAQNYVKDRTAALKELILPLMQDLSNPSPNLGWAHEERQSLQERGPADVILALALVHHLAIGNNLPLEAIAEYFSRIGRHLIIEFIPKNDSKVQILLHRRANMFPDYTPENFEAAFGKYFNLIKSRPVASSQRVIYLYKAKAANK